ncbi:MAG: hypothetical protein V4606_02625 [Patescibacteria group bacterium]
MFRMIAICALALAHTSPTIASESLAAEGKEVEQMIAQYFPDKYSTMVAIASCESTGLVHRESDGSLIKNHGGGSARGVFQVLMRVHAPEMKKMGLDPNNDDDYMTYVRHLTKEYGLSPWNASKKCWKNKLHKYKKPVLLAMS